MLQPPKIFLNNFFDEYEVKLGGVVLGMGVIKENNRGGLVKFHDAYFVHFFKYLTRDVLQTCYVDENHHFLTHSAKIPAKIPCFYDFLAKNVFLLIFKYIFNSSNSSILRARWLYDVTVTPYDV